MKIIICTDLNNGMLFNNRRQSKDKKLINHICNLINNEKLWITDFSKDLFKDNWNRTYPADTYLDISLEDWILESEIDIEGYSHEKITQKIYKRGDK